MAWFNKQVASASDPLSDPLGLPLDIFELILQYPAELPTPARQRVEQVLQRCEAREALVNQKLRQVLDRTKPPLEQPAFLELEPVMADTSHQIAICKGLLSALRKFPQEVLLEVFKCYLAPPADFKLEVTESLGSEWSKPFCHPGALRAVNRWWNSLLLRNPALLSETTVFAGMQDAAHPPLVHAQHARMVSELIGRSMNVTKSLRIDAAGVDMRWDEDIAPSPGQDNLLLSDVLQRSAFAPIQRLKITGNTLSLGLEHVTFPNVKSVVIRYTKGGRYVANVRGKGVYDIPVLPALTQAVFQGMSPFGIKPFGNDTPWGNLTHLYLGDVTRSQARAVLKLCSSLEVGCLQVSIQHETDSDREYPLPEAHRAPFDLPRLRELTILDVSPFEKAWTGVTAPSFTKLRMFLDRKQQLAIHRNALDTGLFANLRHLTLVSPHALHPDHLLPILGATPKLTELFCRLGSGLERVLKYLTLSVPDKRYSLPSLEALGLYMLVEHYKHSGANNEPDTGEDSRPTFPYDALKALLVSRTEAVSKGEFNHVKLPKECTDGFSKLCMLVVRTTDAEGEMIPMLDELKAIVGEFRTFGLNSIGQPGDDGMNGTAPRPMYRHWDEGFMEFVDEVEEYQLYPHRNRAYRSV